MPAMVKALMGFLRGMVRKREPSDKTTVFSLGELGENLLFQVPLRPESG
jgi:hypothetical protein